MKDFTTNTCLPKCSADAQQLFSRRRPKMHWSFSGIQLPKGESRSAHGVCHVNTRLEYKEQHQIFVISHLDNPRV